MEGKRSEPDKASTAANTSETLDEIKIGTKLSLSEKRNKNAKESYNTEDSLYYKLNDERKKLAFIFNHRKYKRINGRIPSTRIGTNKDRESLEKWLNVLGFTVKCFSDSTRKHIAETINEISKIKNVEVNCVMIIVLTHGENNVLFASDEIYSINSLIRPIVTSGSLIGIPKIFIFQACRGKMTDEGHEIELDGEGPVDDFPVMITNADYLCMFSSVEGHLAWREENGSWLIQTLCQKLEKHWEKLDFIDILTLVNHTMAYEKITNTYDEYDPNSYLYHNKKGMSQIESTLTKFINFTK